MARKKPIISPLGQWAYPGEVTVIPSSKITMKGVNYPVLGVDDLGNQQMMMPGGEYDFPGQYVTEYPQMQFGGMSKRKVDKILNKNKDLNFVQRMYQPNTPSMMIPGQQHPSTHFMESGDGRVYPKVVQMPDGTLQYLGDNAYDYANQTGQYIEFPNDRQARRFAKSYKKGTGVLEEFGKGGWLNKYQTGGAETSTEQNPERMQGVNINVKRKKVSDNPKYQYDNEGNLLYAPDLNINPYALDNSTRDNFWVNPKLPIKNLNPTVEELRQVAAAYYPIDNKLISDSKINLQPSNYQQSLEKDYVLPQAVGKSFGNLPIVKDDGYSPNRRWVSNLRAPNTGSRYSKDYAYVLKTNPDSLVNYSNKKNIENSLSLNNKVFYDYLEKNNYSPDTVEGLTRKLPDQIWNRAEQMRVEMRNNPEIMSWANLHNLDLAYKEPGKGDDFFAPKIPESIYANRLAEAGLPTNRPDFDYSPQETYVIQDPSKFDLAGYFPMNSIVNDAEQKVLNKKIPAKLKRESIIGKDSFEKESYIKDEIAKRMGIDPSAFNSGEYLIHYNQTPITEYTPGKKYGGWLEEYQMGGRPTYQDSLALYNYNQLQRKLENKSDEYNPSFAESIIGNYSKVTPQGKKDQNVLRAEALKILKNNPNIKSGLYNIPNGLTRSSISDYDAAEGSYDLYHPGIKPQGAWFGIATNNDYSNVKPKEAGLPTKQLEVVKPISKVKNTVRPIYTSNPKDPRIGSYRDSLNLYNQYLKPAEINKTLKEIKNDSRFRYYRPSNRTELNNFPGKIKPILGTEFDFSRIGADLISGRSTKHNYYPTYDSSGRIIPGEIGTHLSFKKPVQPYVYKKPEVVPEVVDTPVVEPPKPSLFVSNIDRDMYTPNGGMAREYNIGITLQDGNRKSFRTEKEFQDWKAANNLDISNAKVSEGKGYSYNYPENKKYGGWLNKYQTGGWAGWTPNVGKPYMRTSPAGNAGYSDNTRVSGPDLNNRKAAEAAQYARKVGSISQGKTKSAYEKAKEASSLVAQAQQRKGSADPLDYVLDMVNPATYAFAASDLIGNTGSAVSNTVQGNFKEAGSDLLNAGLNTLYLLPAAAELRGPLKSAGKYLTTQTPLKNTYKYNPWAFKSNEANWYRQVGKSAIDDALETRLVREAGEEVSPRMYQEFEDQLVRMQGSGPEAMLASRRPISPFFSKGELFYPMGRKPTITKSGKISKNPAGKGDADYLIETNLPNESFQPAYVKGMSLGTPTEIGQTAILKPNPALRDIENFNFYKQDWLRGYKPVDVPNVGQMSVTPPVGGHVKNIAKELLGLTRNPGNKAAIAEGNTWLKNWIDDPVTQAKIDSDLGWIPQRGNVLKDKFDLGYEQAKSFRPNTKEYPISNQIQDLGESLFLKNPNEHMHAGNKGISNLYNKSPLERDLIKNNNTFDPEYNSFVSRNPGISQNQRALTTTHEGTHDWASDFLLTESGQKQDILNLLSPNTKVLSNQFNKLRNQGVSSKEILKTMGKENAYKGYFATPTETHAKIMEIRKAFNMTPEQSRNLTPGQAKNIMNILDRGENVTNINPTFLDVIDRDPKKLATLFNRLWAVPAVAAASQLQEQKKGGQTSWLNKYK